MRRDRLGHAWKWSRDRSNHAVCPFCGLERKMALRGPKGAHIEGFRPIGASGPWYREAGRCSRKVQIGRTIVWRRARIVVMGVALVWPARFKGIRSGRKVVIPAMRYWRERRAGAK